MDSLKDRQSRHASVASCQDFFLAGASAVIQNFLLHQRRNVVVSVNLVKPSVLVTEGAIGPVSTDLGREECFTVFVTLPCRLLGFGHRLVG